MNFKYFLDYEKRKCNSIEMRFEEGDLYYEEVRSHIENGLKQVILSEELMIELTVYLMSVGKMSVDLIKLRDKSINEKINSIVENAKIDSNYNALLVLELCKAKDIEIDKISLKSNLGEITFVSNGKVMINGSSKLVEYMEDINHLIEEWIFKFS